MQSCLHGDIHHRTLYWKWGEIGPTPGKKQHPEGTHLSNRFRSDPSNLFTFLWNRGRFISTSRSFLPAQMFQLPPGEPRGSSWSGGIYNPFSKSLAFALKEGQPRRQPTQTVGPRRPALLRLFSLQMSDLLILPTPRPERTQSSPSVSQRTPRSLATQNVFFGSERLAFNVSLVALKTETFRPG